MSHRKALMTIVLVLAAAACGKSAPSSSAPTPLSHEDLIAQADTICGDVNGKIAAAKTPGDPSQATAAEMPAWTDYFDTTLPPAQAGLAKLKALGPSAADASAAGAVFDAFGTTNDDAAKARDAAKAGNVSDFKAAADQLSTDNDSANKAAAAFGFKTCSM